MGRVKVQLKKIENKTYKHITFAKRKSGLVKKAHELSTLCDVEVALIIFSPAGKLFLFDGKNRIEEIFARYMDLPTRRRGWIENQEVVRRIISQMRLEASLFDGPSVPRNVKDIDTQLKEVEKAIQIDTHRLEDVDKQLQYYLKNPSHISSISEVSYQEMVLEETLKLVHFRKRMLEANAQTSKEFGVNFMSNMADPMEINPLDAQKASLDYNFMNWPSQNVHHQAPTNFTDEHSRNFDGYMYRPYVPVNFPPMNMDTMHQAWQGAGSGSGSASASAAAEQREAGSWNLDSDPAWFLR